jgi:hypothetical protein
MPKKDLKYFMREHKEEIITVAGPASIKDEDGNVINLEVKVLDQQTITKINDNYRKRSIATDRKGNPIIYNGEVVWKTEKDTARATRHILAEALVFPNLKDESLMEFYNCHDITEMPLKVFPTAEEYDHVIRVVFAALGIGSFEAEAEEQGESEVEDAKN